MLTSARSHLQGFLLPFHRKTLARALPRTTSAQSASDEERQKKS